MYMVPKRLPHLQNRRMGGRGIFFFVPAPAHQAPRALSVATLIG